MAQAVIAGPKWTSHIFKRVHSQKENKLLNRNQMTNSLYNMSAFQYFFIVQKGGLTSKYLVIHVLQKWGFKDTMATMT